MQLNPGWPGKCTAEAQLKYFGMYFVSVSSFYIALGEVATLFLQYLLLQLTG